ncbi:hypothetical protein AMELA_G00087090 [Ameiurus melas]|uniref:Ankyrin repeat and SOCS box protein 18 n=1 Tax=Ameiurus melas TaxID=219545 RepID=A0A7J6AV06_AMEME|nr:hypothetical protein AMELA_G00087090 [Ameiurus melas]
MSSGTQVDYPLHSEIVQTIKNAQDKKDFRRVESLLRDLTKEHPDAVIELSNDDWMKDPNVQLPPAVLVGLWSLEYKQELTSPLCIAAAQGFADCLLYLLENGAHPNLSAGGKAALHEACTYENSKCAELLLEHGANPNQLTEDGLAPLHMCRTPQSLRYGANVNQADNEHRTPLHKAARNVQISLVQLLLNYGADINAIDYNGCSPLSNVLQKAILRQKWQPDIVVQTLLNHGAIKVWPQALLKVLTACAAAPKTVEILFNSYTLVPVTYKWAEAIPEDIFKLPVPKVLQDYLLLKPEGYIN